jgi:hypothetical protein
MIVDAKRNVIRHVAILRLEDLALAADFSFRDVAASHLHALLTIHAGQSYQKCTSQCTSPFLRVR